MSNSRSENTKRNIFSGVFYKIIIIILPFLIRTAILSVFGEQHVGLSGLFTSILQVLNLAELGFSNAIIFNLYKPLAEGNNELVCNYMEFYRKIYFFIGCIILALGILIMPIVPKLVKESLPNGDNILFLYFLYLVNSSISYFLFAYKSALLNAMQRLDLVNIVLLITSIAKYIAQLLIIIYLKNFYLYVIIGIIASVINNLITAYITDKKYPEYIPKGKLDKSLILTMKKQVGGLMICKLGDISRNSFDSIVLSILFGLTAVAIYNNYYYICSSLCGVLLAITHAMQASVGNSITSESNEKNYYDLRKFQFLFTWIVSWCTVCMLCLYQPFMKIWVGERLMLSSCDMVLFCIYFYAINQNNMRNLYFTGNGLWWNGKNIFILEALSNLILNFLLGSILGTTGILLATIVTIFLFNFIARTNMVFKLYFKRKPFQFYFDHFKYGVVVTITAWITYNVCDLINISGILELLLRCVICCFLPNILFILFYLKNNQFKDAYEFVLKIINKV